MVFETTASAIPPTRLGRHTVPDARPTRRTGATSETPSRPGSELAGGVPERAASVLGVEQSEVAARRVIVAEDEALIRMDLAEMLGEEGYLVVGQAANGDEAIRLAEELRPDVVLMDVKMPVLDGISAAERITGARIAPVVLLTAFSQRDLIDRAREAGAMGYLVKPFNRSDLAPAIEMAVSRFAEIVLLETEVGDLAERLETRKLLDRAKGVLQEQLNLSEADAFRWIQKTAMDLRLDMRAVAEGVLTHGLGKPNQE